jgi:hypothetical protein
MTDFNPTFKGIWIPDFILEMVVEKELTAIDILLLSMIFALSKNDGCYASREYLANICGVKEQTVKNLLAKYRKMGLIIDLEFDGRRQKICTIWDKGYRYEYGSRTATSTPAISSSDPSSERGTATSTAHMATNNINNIEIGKNVIDETQKEETQTTNSLTSWLEAKEARKANKGKWRQQSYQKPEPAKHTGTLEDSLVDNLPMIDGACGQEIKDMAERCHVLKKDVFNKKNEYIAWVMAKPNDPSRWGLNMKSMVEVFINRAVASGEIEKRVSAEELLRDAGYQIVGKDI